MSIFKKHESLGNKGEKDRRKNMICQSYSFIIIIIVLCLPFYQLSSFLAPDNLIMITIFSNLILLFGLVKKEKWVLI